MLPSFYLSNDKARGWSIARAAACGAGIGLVAALLKTLGPWHGAIGGGVALRGGLLVNLPEIVGATLGFALLCAAVAALRNFIAQRLIWPNS